MDSLLRLVTAHECTQQTQALTLAELCKRIEELQERVQSCRWAEVRTTVLALGGA